jgi:hypothetical protein
MLIFSRPRHFPDSVRIWHRPCPYHRHWYLITLALLMILEEKLVLKISKVERFGFIPVGFIDRRAL